MLYIFWMLFLVNSSKLVIFTLVIKGLLLRFSGIVKFWLLSSSFISMADFADMNYRSFVLFLGVISGKLLILNDVSGVPGFPEFMSYLIAYNSFD